MLNDENCYRLDRRRFISTLARSAISAPIALSIGPLLSSCATITETRQDVESTNWQVNPYFKVPKNQCHLAFHSLLTNPGYGTYIVSKPSTLPVVCLNKRVEPSSYLT